MSLLPRRTEVLVIGGGIQGAAALYECARRGLEAVLVERDDFGAGASGNSMRIAHGGLRYLQHLDIARSTVSALERARLLSIAAPYWRPLPCRMDLTGRGSLFRLAFAGGLFCNALLNRLAASRLGEGARLPRGDFPCWYDALIEDSEGLLLAFLHTARALGDGTVHARNHTPVATLLDASGRIAAARVGDEELEVGQVLRCTGAAIPGRPAVLSMNLVFDELGLAEREALALPHPEGRHVFLVPWRGMTIAGTRDVAYAGDTERPPSVTGSEVDETLRWLGLAHPRLAALSRRDVRGVHAGLLPGSPKRGEPARRARIEEAEDGAIEVQTEKWTTARDAASQAVRRTARALGNDRAAAVDDRDLPALLDRAVLASDFCARYPEHGEPAFAIEGAPTRGAVRFAVEREGARELEDLLLRRLEAPRAWEADFARGCAEAMGGILGWDGAERERQLAAFETSRRLAGLRAEEAMSPS